MPIPKKPIIDNWYIDEERRSLKVVAVDEDGDTVEVQYFDGDVEEFDLENWYQMVLEPIAEPEDWSGPFDDLVADDMGDTDRAKRPEDWNGPTDEMDQEE